VDCLEARLAVLVIDPDLDCHHNLKPVSGDYD